MALLPQSTAPLPESQSFSSELIRKGILQKGAKQPGAKWDWKSYLLLLKEKIGETLPYGPQLHVPLRKYKSFDQILSSPDDGDPIEDFAEHVLSSGATLLHGAGGSGKSVLLHHMTIILIEREVIPIIVDLSALRTLEAEAEDTVRIPPAHLLKRMLSLVVPRPIGTEALSDLEGQAVLILDGFNELSNNPEDDPIQKRILACLQTVRADHPDLKVIVADRFHPRPEANAFGYGRLSVRPLEVTEVAKLIPNYDSLAEATKEILRVPFFLSLWLLRGKEEHHATHMNKAEMLKDALTKRAKLDDASLEKLGVVMYEAYRSGSQYFRPESIKFADSKLLAAGFLIVQKSASGSEQLCRFSHQLLHDYLAGLHVAKENVPWDEDTFDALSLRAQSLETIQLTLEQVPILRREEFLSRVYDWNYTSALLCLAEEERLALSHGVTEEIRTAIIASIAEKQFDSFPHSRALNIRALGQLPKTLREPFLRTGTKTEKEIRDYVRTLQSRSQWFVTWQSLFARLAGGTIEAYDLQYVVDENPLIGWAAASLIRRSIFEKRILERLLGILIGLGNGRANRSKRWRIISVLGASDEPEALIELFQRLTTDEYRWVRYGAMRSVIEIAARNKGQRGKIFKELLSLVGQLHELSRYELSRVLRIEKADEDWLFLS